MKNVRLAILFICFFIVIKIYNYLEIQDLCYSYADYNKSGLTGYYYSHPHWQGEPFLIRIDKEIDFSNSSSEIFQNTQFSARWIGILDIPKTGIYTLGIGADDSAWLYIDERLILKNPGLHPFKKVSKRIILNRGYHLLELRYIQAEGQAEIKLYCADNLIPLKTQELSPYYLANFRQNALFIILGLLLILRTVHSKYSLPLIGIVIMGGFMRFLYLGSIPGLHGDEAWAGLRALEIIDGMRPLSGLCFYTGPGLHYILAAAFSIFGISVFTLRAVVSLINTINIILIYKLTKQVYNKTAGITAALLLASMPWHIMYSRFVLEHTFLTIFLALLSLYILTKSNRKLWHICIAGFLMGLGTYNYLLFLTLPVSIILLYIFYTRGKALFKKELWLGILSFCIGYMPKLYDNYRMGVNLFSFAENAGSSTWDFIKNLWAYLWVFLQSLDGTILYQRFCGNIANIPIPINSTLFLWSICLCLIARRKDLLLLAIFILNYCLVVFITKTPYLRFFLIPLTLAVIIMSRRINIYIAIIIASINIFYIYSNYKTDANPSLFVYAKTMDTSNHFMDTNVLYKFIVEKGIEDVYVNSFLYEQLEFWDVRNRSIRIWSIEEPTPRKNSWLIFYNGPSLYPLEDITTYKYHRGNPVELPDNLRYRFRIYET